jgi:hypothetical protein
MKNKVEEVKNELLLSSFFPFLDKRASSTGNSQKKEKSARIGEKNKLFSLLTLLGSPSNEEK